MKTRINKSAILGCVHCASDLIDVMRISIVIELCNRNCVDINEMILCCRVLKVLVVCMT